VELGEVKGSDFINLSTSPNYNSPVTNVESVKADRIGARGVEESSHFKSENHVYVLILYFNKVLINLTTFATNLSLTEVLYFLTTTMLM
jgi:hypothetical protein